MLKHVLSAGGAAGALATAYLLGALTLGGAVAAPGPAQPTPTGDQSGPRQQQPAYTSSIAVPQNQTGQSETDEAAALLSQAKITADAAKAAALAKFPGATARGVGIDNENGALVYSVSLTDSAGKGQDVKVDAGNGAVLHVEADEAGGAEGGGNVEG